MDHEDTDQESEFIEDMELKDVLADNVLVLREERGWRQADLAERMKALGFRWTQNTVSDSENGRRTISIEEWFGLSVAFEEPPWRLVAKRDLKYLRLGHTGELLAVEDLPGFMVSGLNFLEGKDGATGEQYLANLDVLLAAESRDRQELRRLRRLARNTETSVERLASSVDRLINECKGLDAPELMSLIEEMLDDYGFRLADEGGRLRHPEAADVDEVADTSAPIGTHASAAPGAKPIRPSRKGKAS